MHADVITINATKFSGNTLRRTKLHCIPTTATKKQIIKSLTLTRLLIILATKLVKSPYSSATVRGGALDILAGTFSCHLPHNPEESH
jgi:hypothetical protein